MKYFVFTLTIVTCFSFLACRKTRTCACKWTDVTTTVVTPRSSAQSTTNVSTTTHEDKNTYSKVKKSDLRRFKDCQSRTETTKNTYTTTVAIPTQSSVAGFTFTTFVSQTADVESSNKLQYSCDIE